jgi:RHS repeat-associated protein
VGEYYERVFPLEMGQIIDNSPVPFGTILPFAAAACPAGWSLISGTGGTFNNQFLQGAPTGQAPGVQGGSSSHQHVYTDVPAHSHTGSTIVVSTSGSHTHSVTRYASTGSGNYPQTGIGAGSNGSTASSGAHTHDIQGTTDATGVTNPSTNTATVLPPYLDMLFCRKTMIDFTGVPQNAVAIFDYGAAQQLPAGWTHFTQLDGKFPRGAAVYGTTGGVSTHLHSFSQVPSHSHADGTLTLSSSGSHSHGYTYFSSGHSLTGTYLQGTTNTTNPRSSSIAVSQSGSHTHTLSGQTDSWGSGATVNTNLASNLPPYQEVPYAQKTVDDTSEFPIGSIMIWQGTSCPATWQRYTLLDGRFPLGAPYVNIAGGSPTHTHTYNDLPAHVHGISNMTVVSGGQHTHNLNFYEFGTAVTTSGRVYGSNFSGTSSNSILNGSGAHTHTVSGLTTSTGVATPTTQSGSNLPPYTTVVFCKKISPSQSGGGGNSTVRKYYFTDEDRVAMRENGMLYFLANDHLGSTSIVIDTNGVKVAEMRYKPWGETRYSWSSLPNFPTNYQYTGQRNDSEIGLYYYGARWYDTTLGRFAQADTNIPASQGTQGWDRYAYVNNNPIQFTDSSGHWIETAFDILSLAMTINDIRNEGFTVMNTISLVTDVAAVVLPIVPAGVSHALRAAKYASKAVNAVDTTADTLKVANKFDNFLDGAKNLFKKADDMVCPIRNSFRADTPVVTSEGDKAIATLQIGDYVLAWNEVDGTLGYYEVIATIHHTDQIVTELIIDGEWIETTPEHPFYVEGKGWVDAEDLQTGDRVRQADGTTGIVWLQWNVHKTQEMYNLTVDTAHTFFVGDGQWLVHNCSAKTPNFDDLDTIKPGPYADKSIAARGPDRDFKDWERAQINKIGQSTGCHTCGTKDPGTKYGDFILDHQPPTKLNFNNVAQRLFPHCAACSRRQGGQVLTALRRILRLE